MAEKRRYYWIKLKDSFMSGDEIDFLMSQKNGAEYVVLYQMLCLMTCNTNGKLQKQLGEVIIQYDAERIQRDCKYFDFDTVVIALELYKKLGLIYEESDGSLQIANYSEMIGTATNWADQKRNQRALKSGQCPPKCLTDSPPQCPPDKEIDKDKEKDKEFITEDKSSVSESVPYELVKDAYNSICKSYPKCTVLSDKRKKAIKARFREGYTLEQIKQVFAMAEESDFLKGKNDRNWSATFDWMLNTNNMAKILDGNYSRGEKNGNQSTGGYAGNTKQSCKYGITL